jgi:hypothetical protein
MDPFRKAILNDPVEEVKEETSSSCLHTASAASTTTTTTTIQSLLHLQRLSATNKATRPPDETSRLPATTSIILAELLEASAPNPLTVGPVTQLNQGHSLPTTLMTAISGSSIPLSGLRQAIMMKKIQLLRSIIQNHQAVPSTTPILQQQPGGISMEKYFWGQEEQSSPNTTHVIETIGSHIRIGMPFIDVTELSGIKQAKAIRPPANRGGVDEAFPQVSRSVWVKSGCLYSRLTCVFSLSLPTEAPPYAQDG